MSEGASYPLPPDEETRVQTLHDLKILDTGAEERFEGLIRDLSKTLDAPIAYLSLIDAERQWLKARVGPIEQEVKREEAFCSHVITGTHPVVVDDAREDPRFASSSLTTESPELRFYAGVPIADTATGQTLGTVCIADQETRQLGARELAILEGFADRVAAEISAQPKALVAYAAEDLDWVQRLLERGPALARGGLLDLWSDLRVASGEDRDWKLEEAIERARLVVLMLSGAFLGSAFLRRGAFGRLLEARRGEGAETVAILLEPCDSTGIDWLEPLRPLAPSRDGLAAAAAEEADEFLARTARDIEAALGRAGRVLPVEQPPDGDGDEETAPPARKLFLSHASEDADAARALAVTLRRAGLDVWLDVDELKPGDDWMAAIETALAGADAFAVYVGSVGVERWIDRELRVALDRNVRDPRFRVIPILGAGADPESLPCFLAQHHWLDLRAETNDPQRIRQLVAAVLDRPAEAVSLLDRGETPFRGLLAFDIEHAHLFFGRDRETDALLQRVRTAPFLAVIGESGSGKSSLVRAGLIPALHGGGFGDASAERWRTLAMRPGTDPFRELTGALGELAFSPDPVKLMELRQVCGDQLERGGEGLAACLGALVPAGQHTLLVIDQFEELFTQLDDQAVRERFIDTLLTAGDVTGERPLHVLITLRADFFSHCFAHPRLLEAVSGSQYALRAIDRNQLCEVIEKPAAMAGLRLEPGLVEAILHDVGEESATLALLEHTLLELWKRRSAETLTHEAYEAIGRVQGALEHHAEEVFAGLDAAQQRIARSLLLQLAVPGRAGAVTRRRVTRRELLGAGGADGAEDRVLHHLVEQRLLTVRRPGSGSAEQAEEVEVAHEALLRGWQRFRGWLRQDREFLLWRQRTGAAFDAWRESGEDSGALLRGVQLEDARCWLETREEDLSEEGRTFIRKSLARDRRARRLRHAALAAIVLLGVAAVIGALVAQVQKRQAERNFAVASMALQQVGEMAEVTGRARAEQPEAVELKREIAERAIGFYEAMRERGAFAADLALEEAVARYRLGNILAAQGRGGAGDAAFQAYDGAVRALERLVLGAPDDVRYLRELANARYWRGEAHRQSGNPVAAGADFDRALETQRRLATAPPAGMPGHALLFELGRTLNGLGVALRRQELFDRAEVPYLEAQASFEAALAEVEPGGAAAARYRQGLAWALNNIAELYEAWGRRQLAAGERAAGDARLESARRSYDAAIANLEKIASGRRQVQLELAVNYNNLGNLLIHLDRLDQAEAANAQAVRLMETLAAPLPEIHDELGNSYLSRGELAWLAERDDEAQEIYHRVREIYDGLAEDPGREALPQYHRRRAMALARLADLGAAEASVELCRLLPRLSAGERLRYDEYCS